MELLKHENFVDISGYENYKVSNYGRVLSIGRFYKNQFGKSTKKSKNKILKQYTTTSGYSQVDLCKDSKYLKISVHRLVALYFVNNENNKTEVNHKDGNKKNNHFENLEWVSSSENKKHAWQNGLYKITDKQRESARRNGLKNKGRRREAK